jgi:hypothetical protein
VRLAESPIVNVQVPAPTAVTVTVVPDATAVTMPLQPEVVYGAAMPSVTITDCGFVVVASNVSAESESDNGAGDGDGLGDGVGIGLRDGDAVGLGDALADDVGVGDGVGLLTGVVATPPPHPTRTTRQAKNHTEAS